MANIYSVRKTVEKYDSARALPPETLDLWIDTLKNSLSIHQIRSILDLGCGTGRFSYVLAEAFSCPVIALDPSLEMITEHKSKLSGNCQWLQGCAENIPINTSSVDLVWMSQVFHHLDNNEKALREIHRILTDGGYLAIRNGTKENDKENYWPQFFPEALEMIVNRIPLSAEILTQVMSAGYRLITHETINQLFAPSFSDYYDKISMRALSPLISISDEEFNSGLIKFKQWVYSQPNNKPVYEKIDLFVFLEFCSNDFYFNDEMRLKLAGCI